MNETPDDALKRTLNERRGCNPTPWRAGALGLGRSVFPSAL